MYHSLLLSLLIALTTVGLASAQSTPKRFALLAGVNKYAERNFEGSPLQFAERDVEELASELKDQGFDRVILLKGSASGKERATGENILTALDQILKEAGATDVVLVALTGHGNQTVMKDKDGKPLEETDGKPKEDILYHPVDAIKTSDLTYPRSISISQILDKLEADGGVNLVLLDACRDVPKDPTRRARLISGNDWKRTMPANTSILFACSGGQLAWESEKASGGHGIFFHTLLEGLRGGAAGVNQRVTWKSLETYVIENTNDNAENIIGKDAKKPGQEELQTPHGIGNVNRNPILVDLKKRIAAAVPFNFADKARTAEEARSAQEAWAKKLGVDLVETNSLGMQMVLIPPGEFLMGTTAADAEELAKKYEVDKSLFDDEQPQHRVRLTKPFRMAAHEVTVAQFRAFVDAEGYKTDAEKTTADGGDGKGGYGYDEEAKSLKQDPKCTWRSPGFKQADNHPVVNVSRNDAIAYVKWLNKKEGTAKYRLPSEAEWEYACRAGTTTWYQSGDDPEGLAKVGNVGDGSLREGVGEGAKSWTLINARDGYAFTAPVGRFRPSGFGLYDLHGNALEWLADAYEKDAYEKSEAGMRVNPTKNDETSRLFVLRGGSWSSNPWYLRSAYRYGVVPGNRISFTGFRLSRTE